MKKTNKTLLKITSLLNDQEFHDGTSIGDKLNITRSAVWKAIKKLETYHIPIASIKSKGYALLEPLILLDSQQIKNSLKTKNTPIEVLEKIDSTNAYLKERPFRDKKSYVCIAESQTAGKGRMQRSWNSPFGKNIYLSLRHPFYKDISEISGLSLIIGLAACQAIEAVCPLPAPLSIKWPNDIIYQGKKLAGILVELEAETHGFCNVIIGVGVNINIQKASLKETSQYWTSLKIITDEHQNRNLICAELINKLLEYLSTFEEHGLKYFLKEWRMRDYLFNRSIKLKSNLLEFKGNGLGINEQGHLLLSLADGSQKAFSSGDTTIIK